MPLDAKELAKEKELNRELSDEEMDRLLIPRRSIGTWVTCGVILVGMIAGGGYLFGARILKAGRDYAAEVAAVGTPEQRQQAQEVLEAINSKLMLWKLQHQGRMPGFDGHPDWEQFTQATDVSGKLRPGRGMPVCGPYLSAKPLNPINNLSVVYTWDDGQPEVGAVLPGGTKAGFVYSKTAGRFWVTDVAGTRVIDPAAAGGGAAPAEKKAPAVTTEKIPAPATVADSAPDAAVAPIPTPTPPPAESKPPVLRRTEQAAPTPAPRTTPAKPAAKPTAKPAPAKKPASGSTQWKSRQ